YVVDVYRGKVKAVRDLPDYALYVSFFPQLVAGPIERAAHMLPQYRQTRKMVRIGSAPNFATSRNRRNSRPIQSVIFFRRGNLADRARPDVVGLLQESRDRR